jgi:hypothetical protein
MMPVLSASRRQRCPMHEPAVIMLTAPRQQDVVKSLGRMTTSPSRMTSVLLARIDALAALAETEHAR